VLIHNNIYDSNNILTCGGKRLFITFINDFSRFYYIYLTNSKSELFDKFKIFKVGVENQIEKKLKILQSNRGGEYILKWRIVVQLMLF